MQRPEDGMSSARLLQTPALFIVLACLCIPAAHVGAQTSEGSAGDAAGIAESRSAVEQLHAALVTIADPERALDFGARFVELLPIVETTHDLRYIAELTIRRQWRDLDEAARTAFAVAFGNLSVATYVARFENIGPETFTVTGAEALDDGRVRVYTEIPRVDQKPVTLEYVLQNRDGAWRIVNILADGVSDLALKRAEYQRLIRDGMNVEELTEMLESQARELGS
jgi:phospholipid transport system substrate-binding protein